MSGLDRARSEVKGAARAVARRVRDAGGGSALEARVAELEREITELRRENLRLAELTDVVTELLVPLASRDQEKIDAALASYPKSL